MSLEPPQSSQATGSQSSLPQIFANISIFVDADIKVERQKLVRALRRSGAIVTPTAASANVLLVDPKTTTGRHFIREWSQEPVLHYTWAHKCIEEGKALLEPDNWGGLREIDDPNRPIEADGEEGWYEGDEQDAPTKPKKTTSTKKKSSSAASKAGPSRTKEVPKTIPPTSQSESSTPPRVDQYVSPPPPQFPQQFPNGHSYSQTPSYITQQQQPQIYPPSFPASQPFNYSQPQAQFQTFGNGSLLGLTAGLTNPTLHALSQLDPQTMQAAFFQALGMAPQQNPPMVPTPSHFFDHQNQPAAQVPDFQQGQDEEMTSTPGGDDYQPEEAPRDSSSEVELLTTSVRRKRERERSPSRGVKRRASSSLTVVEPEPGLRTPAKKRRSMQEDDVLRLPYPPPSPAKPKPTSSASQRTAPSPGSTIFTDLSGRPITFFVQVDMGNRAATTQKIKKAGGRIAVGNDSDFALLDATKPDFANLLKGVLNSNKVALKPSYVHDCVESGELLDTDRYIFTDKDVPSRRGGFPLKKTRTRKEAPPKPKEKKEKKPMAPRRDGTRSPSPPVEKKIRHSSGNYLFTAAEREYGVRLARFFIEKEPLISGSALAGHFERKMPHHNKLAWGRYIATTLKDDLAEIRKTMRGASKPAEPESLPPHLVELGLTTDDIKNIMIMADFFSEGVEQYGDDESAWAELLKRHPNPDDNYWPNFFEAHREAVQTQLDLLEDMKPLKPEPA